MAHSAWGAKDGLLNVEALAQTPDGYLWIATGDGLFRFDGLDFVHWQPKPDEPALGKGISALCASRDGSLWIGGSAGISCLQSGGQTNLTSLAGLPRGEVTSILEDRAGAIWVATAKGLGKLVNGRWIEFGKTNGLPEGKIRVELEDRSGNLWIAVDDPAVAGGTLLGCLRSGTNQFEFIPEHLGTVAMLREASDGQLWVAETSRSVRPFPSQSGMVSSELPVPSKAILFDRDGTFWVSTAGRGLFRVSDVQRAATSSETNLPPDRFNEKDGLSSDFLTCALEDREGNIWFGSASGLDRFHENKIVSISVADGLSYDQRLAIAAGADGSLWTGSDQGFQRLHGTKMEAFGFETIGQGGINGVYSLYAAAAGDVWVGALNGVGQIKGGVLAPVEIDGGMELHNVTAITGDFDGGIWLCDQLRGVCRFFNGKVRVFPSSPNLPAQTVNAALTDAAGAIWLGFQDGSISRYKDGHFQVFFVPQSVLALHCDRADQVWAVGQGGISRFQTDHFETLSQLNGLPSGEVSGIVEDDAGYFWLAGRAAILRVHPKELAQAFADPAHPIASESYGAAEGLRGVPRQGRPFPVTAKTRDGRVWFATTAGLAVIDPRHFKKNSNPPPVHILRAVVDGQVLENPAELPLPAGTKEIKFDYTALSLVDAGKIRFRCQLDGYDHDWREVGALRQAAYANLPPRAYEFRVTACNNDDVWATTAAVWQFSIRPAFYQTTWFLVAGVAAAALLIWLVYRWNLARATARAEARLNTRLEAQMDERKRIAQELHDTLLQGFTGVRLKLWAIAHQLPDASAARDQLNKVIQQSDQCLTESRRSVWALRSQRLEEGDLAAALAATAKQLLAQTPLQLEFHVQGEPEKLSGIVEFNLLRIGEEALTNVIKHAAASRVTLTLQFAPRRIQLRIADNGRGFDPASPFTGQGEHFGLAGMRERAEIVGGTLVIQSQPGGPTEVTVTIG